jgi:hypothetical protein
VSDAVADVWLRSFAAELASVRRAHPDDEVRARIRDEVIGELEAWVATTDDAVVGIMALQR